VQKTDGLAHVFETVAGLIACKSAV
jgi:hypothetical protein